MEVFEKAGTAYSGANGREARVQNFLTVNGKYFDKEQLVHLRERLYHARRVEVQISGNSVGAVDLFRRDRRGPFLYRRYRHGVGKTFHGRRMRDLGVRRLVSDQKSCPQKKL